MTRLGCIADDCAFETVCETCVRLASGPEFVPILLHQSDHAAERDQQALVTVYDRLLNRIDNQQPNPPSKRRVPTPRMKGRCAGAARRSAPPPDTG